MGKLLQEEPPSGILKRSRNEASSSFWMALRQVKAPSSSHIEADQCQFILKKIMLIQVNEPNDERLEEATFFFLLCPAEGIINAGLLTRMIPLAQWTISIPRWEGSEVDDR